MEDSIYTLQEQKELSNILDDFIKMNEEQFLLLGEEIAYEDFKDIILSEEITGGSVKRAVRDTQAKIQRADKKVSRAVDNTADAVIDGGKKNEIKSIREDLMRGRGKISTIMKRAIKAAIVGCAASAVAGAGLSMAPAIALIAFIVSTIRRRHISEAEKKKIVWEMNRELEIIEEKKKDAETEGNTKLKYQYIRLYNEVKRNRDQIMIFGKIQQRD